MNKITNIHIKNESIFPINREDLMCGELVNPSDTQRRLVILTYPRYNTFSSPEMKDHFTFTPFHKELAIDLNYIAPQYELCTIRQKRENICYDYDTLINLDFLLNYFGFSKKLDPEDYRKCLNILFNGKFPYENCQEFGYYWIDNGKWGNGERIEDMQTKYNSKFYKKIPQKGYERPSPMLSYFKLLTSIDYTNPEAAFKPLEEEGPIRKRILVDKVEENE